MAHDKVEILVVGKRHIKQAYRVFSYANIDNQPELIGLVVFRDNQGKYVYDMYVNEKYKKDRV